MPRKKENEKKVKAIKKDRVVKEEKINIDFDNIKDDLYKYTDEVVKKYYLNEIEKVNKIIIRDKNKKILFRNFIITLLLLIIVYLLYLLTTVDFFSNFNKENDTKETTIKEVVSSKKEDSQEEDTQPSLSELKDTYGYLLDNIVINEKSKYLKDFYNNNLTDELKNYLALNNLDFKKLDLVDNYNMFSESLLKDSFNDKLMGEYNSISFNYNDNTVRYISKLNAYITDSVLEKTKSNIKKEIISINVDDNIVTIVTVEGLINNNKLYNIITNEEVEGYNGDSIINYVDSLNKVTYTFENKKLSSIK